MLPPWLPTAILIAAALGFISHYAFWVRFEFDGILYQFVPGIVFLQGLSFMFLNYIGLTVIESTLVFAAIQTTYLVTLFASISLYRLFFHPTRIYPGPFYARLWSWWKIKAFINHNEQGYAVFDELHQKYGDVIRIGWWTLPHISPSASQHLTLSGRTTTDFSQQCRCNCRYLRIGVAMLQVCTIRDGKGEGPSISSGLR
jgi:hypothetical protein